MKTLSDEGKQEFGASRPILKEWLKQVLPWYQGFPGSSVGKESTCNAGDPSSIPGLGRYAGEGIGYPLQYSWASLVAQLVKNLPAVRETWVGSLLPGEGKGYPFQDSGLENSTDCVVHGVAKSQTRLSDFHYHKWQTFIFLWVSSFPLYVSIHPLLDTSVVSMSWLF